MFSVLRGGFRSFKILRFSHAQKCVRFAKQWDPIALQALIAHPTKKDLPKIKQLIKTCIMDDPLFSVSGLPSCEPCIVDYLMDKVAQGNSLIARSADGTLIGVAVNSVNSREEETELRYLAEQAWSDSCKRICYFWAYLEKHPPVWAHFEIDYVWQIKVFVDPLYRRHGIAKLLTQASRGCARKQDYQLVKMQCNNHYAARAAQSLGFTCVLNTPLQTYLTRERTPLFKEYPAPPHDVVKVYVDKLK